MSGSGKRIENDVAQIKASLGSAEQDVEGFMTLLLEMVGLKKTLERFKKVSEQMEPDVFNGLYEKNALLQPKPRVDVAPPRRPGPGRS